MKVILTEKPSVAKDIAKVLKAGQRKDGYFEGNGYYITWAYGHLIRLVYPESYDDKYKNWQLSDLPVIPESFIRALNDDPGVSKQYKVISGLFNNDKVTEVICATDAGREGELIFRFIYEFSRCNKEIKRLWISSQTDKAIQDGFSSLKPGSDYQPLYHSAVSRTEADWLIGMNATRAYTIKFSTGKGVMSVGRVQTPVLKMIVDRYYENTNFKPENYYEIFVKVKHKNGEYKGKWFAGKDDRFFDKGIAEAVIADIKKNPDGTIIKVTGKERKEKQPLLYDLTELQKDSNRRFGYSADQTLKIMQDLYEKHKLLTYPRTSSRYLSSDIIPELETGIKNLLDLSDYSSFAEKILEKKLKITKRIVDDSRVTDHHAIIPTDKKARTSDLSKEELNIFDLVIKRFLAVFMDECVKDQTDIITAFGESKFKTMGVVTKKQGWRAVYSGSASLKDLDDSDKLPEVKEKDEVEQKESSLESKQTKAPPLYTEASILASMETAGKQIDDDELREAIKDCGLGTPATRAQILERLINVKYIKRDKNKLIPTQKGCHLIACIQDRELLSSELTGQWEKKLNDIAQRKYSRAEYMDKIIEFTSRIVDNVKKSDKEIFVPVTNSIGDCYLCDGSIVETKLSFSCSNWKSRGCKFAVWKSIAGKVITKQLAVELLEKKETSVIKGFKSKAGKTFDAALIIKKDNTIGFKFPDPDGSRQSLGKCPLCNAEIYETAKAFSCSKWKSTGCKFAIWKIIAGKQITESIAKKLLKQGETQLLKGFKNRSGASFETRLVLKNGRVEFVF